jgi:oxygen-dependent protoporphyrinogen oxidase
LIAIVGAGITGLALTHHLSNAGVPNVVLEAGGRVGGVMRSGRVDGHLLEWGPQRGRMTASLAELVRDLGLESEVVTAPPGLPLFVYRAGKLRKVPFSARDFLATDLLSLRGKLRVLAEPFTRGADPSETVGGFLTRKLGREAFDNLLGPLYGGLYASDPADMVVGLSLSHVLRELGIGGSLLLPLLRRGGKIQAPPAIGFREGMQTLPLALHHRHVANIRVNAPVHAISRSGGGWRVEAEGETVEAEHVVLTVPAPVASRLLAPIAPEAAERIGRLRYNPLAVVHLYAEGTPAGLGYQVSLAERKVTRGVTFNHWLFGRTGVHTAYLGGAKAPEVAEMDDARLGEIALAELRQATGCDARVLSVAHERMPAWDRSWEATRGLALPPGIHAAANWESRPGIPGRLAQAQRLAKTLAGAPVA